VSFAPAADWVLKARALVEIKPQFERHSQRRENLRMKLHAEWDREHVWMLGQNGLQRYTVVPISHKNTSLFGRV